MKTKIITFLLICFTFIIGKSQDNNGFGLGFDFNLKKEIKIKEYSTSYVTLGKTYHFNYLPSFYYSFSNNSSLGILLGLGNAKSESLNESTNYKGTFKSKSYELGLYYKYCYSIFKNLRIFGQPDMRLIKINQDLKIRQVGDLTGNYMFKEYY